MFTRSDLVTALGRFPFVNADPSPMTVIEFGNVDFISPSSEQTIWAVRGVKRHFPDGADFWLTSLRVQDGWREEATFVSYASAGLCDPLADHEFSGIVAEYTGSLARPVPAFLREMDGFKSGLRMYAEWNDVAAVAELTDAFVAFYWSTTA